MSAKAKIAVVGSLNIDFTYLVARIPAPGETVASRGLQVTFGGKGANQAIAAHRAAGAVELVGSVGSDDHGARYLEALLREGIGVESVKAVPGLPTGSAAIVVEASGENTIVVEPGANGAVNGEMIQRSRPAIEEADVLLIQLECPLEALAQASEMARASGIKIVVNPSPWSAAFLSAGILADYLIVNEREAALLLNATPELLEGLETGKAKELGVEALIITRGARSTLVVARDAERVLEVPALSVTPVDTVGAGDSFAGALAVAIAEGLPLERAVRFANAAGALATQKRGAQSAIPFRKQIEESLVGLE